MAIDGDTLATARIRLVADARGMAGDVRAQTQRGLGAEADRAGSQFGKRMMQAVGAAVAVGAGVIGAKLLGGLKESIQAASDLNEVSSKVGVVFGKSAADVRKWSEHMATDFGQSKKQALDAAATFAIYGKAAKLTGSNLVNFSTHLTTLASDMASFSNSTPEEAIDAIGSALRGEFDPIERYGVLLNETNVKQEALRKGLIKTTTDALTPQQRVLAVQSLIFKQTKDAMGDFERTSAGLANQQRIASAQIENLKAKIGAGLLPVAVKLTQVFNSQVIPALQALWAKHGPAITKTIEAMGLKLADFIAAIARGDFSAKFDELRTTFDNLRAKAVPALQALREQLIPAAKGFKEDLVPALKQLKDEGGQGLADTLNVTAVAMKFLADHTELLAQALPALVIAYGAFKVAQLGSNIAMAASPVLRLLEVRATKQQTAAIIANTAARAGEAASTVVGTATTGTNTAATNVNTAAKARGRIASLAAAAATYALAAAEKVATVAARALGIAFRFMTGPVGLAITAIALMVTWTIHLWKTNADFRNQVMAVWKAVRSAIGAVASWFTGTIVPSLRRAINQAITAYNAFKAAINAVFRFVRAYIQAEIAVIMSTFRAMRTFVLVTLPNAYHSFQNAIRTSIRAVAAIIQDRVNFVLGIFGKLRTFVTQTLPNAFRSGVNAIGNAWNTLRQKAREPVAFVVNQVINRLIGGYNRVAGIFGAPKAATIGGFAAGGRIPGAPSAVDNIMGSIVDKAGRFLAPVQVATGEFIVNAKDTAKALPLLQWINNGMKGGASEAARYIGRRPVNEPGDGSEGFAFADGGFVGFLKDVWGAVSNPKKLIAAPINAALSHIPGSGFFRNLLVNMSKKLLNGLMNFVGGGGGASGNIGRAQAFVRAQAGKPYVWASAGPGGYDCSGIVSAVYNVLKGRNPYSHTFSTGSLPGPWFDTSRKIGPLVGAWSHPGQRPASASVGHMAGMIGGLPFESTGSRGVRVGGAARRITDFANIGVARARGGMIPVFDAGGVLWPGLNTVYNGTGRPETVTPTDNGLMRLHPADLETFARIIAREMITALGAGAYSAGRTASIYARGG